MLLFLGNSIKMGILKIIGSLLIVLIAASSIYSMVSGSAFMSMFGTRIEATSYVYDILITLLLIAAVYGLFFVLPKRM